MHGFVRKVGSKYPPRGTWFCRQWQLASLHQHNAAQLTNSFMFDLALDITYEMI